MSIVNGTFSVKCSGCGKQHDFSADDADFENTSSDERQMGPENAYTWDTSFKCDDCGNEIEIEYGVWEYPTGAFNHDDVKIKGAVEVNRFGYDFSDGPEPEDLEQ